MSKSIIQNKPKQQKGMLKQLLDIPKEQRTLQQNKQIERLIDDENKLNILNLIPHIIPADTGVTTVNNEIIINKPNNSIAITDIGNISEIIEDIQEQKIESTFDYKKINEILTETENELIIPNIPEYNIEISDTYNPNLNNGTITPKESIPTIDLELNEPTIIIPEMEPFEPNALYTKDLLGPSTFTEQKHEHDPQQIIEERLKDLELIDLQLENNVQILAKMDPTFLTTYKIELEKQINNYKTPSNIEEFYEQYVIINTWATISKILIDKSLNIAYDQEMPIIHKVIDLANKDDEKIYNEYSLNPYYECINLTYLFAQKTEEGLYQPFEKLWGSETVQYMAILHKTDTEPIFDNDQKIKLGEVRHKAENSINKLITKWNILKNSVIDDTLMFKQGYEYDFLEEYHTAKEKIGYIGISQQKLFGESVTDRCTKRSTDYTRISWHSAHMALFKHNTKLPGVNVKFKAGPILLLATSFWLSAGVSSMATMQNVQFGLKVSNSLPQWGLNLAKVAGYAPTTYYLSQNLEPLKESIENENWAQLALTSLMSVMMLTGVAGPFVKGNAGIALGKVNKIFSGAFGTWAGYNAINMGINSMNTVFTGEEIGEILTHTMFAGMGINHALQSTPIKADIELGKQKIYFNEHWKKNITTFEILQLRNNDGSIIDNVTIHLNGYTLGTYNVLHGALNNLKSNNPNVKIIRNNIIYNEYVRPATANQKNNFGNTILPLPQIKPGINIPAPHGVNISNTSLTQMETQSIINNAQPLRIVNYSGMLPAYYMNDFLKPVNDQIKLSTSIRNPFALSLIAQELGTIHDGNIGDIMSDLDNYRTTKTKIQKVALQDIIPGERFGVDVYDRGALSDYLTQYHTEYSRLADLSNEIQGQLQNHEFDNIPITIIATDKNNLSGINLLGGQTEGDLALKEMFQVQKNIVDRLNIKGYPAIFASMNPNGDEGIIVIFGEYAPEIEQIINNEVNDFATHYFNEDAMALANINRLHIGKHEITLNKEQIDNMSSSEFANEILDGYNKADQATEMKNQPQLIRTYHPGQNINIPHEQFGFSNTKLMPNEQIKREQFIYNNDQIDEWLKNTGEITAIDLTFNFKPGQENNEILNNLKNKGKGYYDLKHGKGGFKTFNTAGGHELGDKVMLKISEGLETTVNKWNEKYPNKKINYENDFIQVRPDAILIKGLDKHNTLKFITVFEQSIDIGIFETQAKAAIIDLTNATEPLKVVREGLNYSNYKHKFSKKTVEIVEYNKHTITDYNKHLFIEKAANLVINSANKGKLPSNKILKTYVQETISDGNFKKLTEMELGNNAYELMVTNPDIYNKIIESYNSPKIKANIDNFSLRNGTLTIDELKPQLTKLKTGEQKTINLNNDTEIGTMTLTIEKTNENTYTISQPNSIHVNDRSKIIIPITEFNKIYNGLVKLNYAANDSRLMLKSYNQITNGTTFADFIEYGLKNAGTPITLLPYAIDPDLNIEFQNSMHKLHDNDINIDINKLIFKQYESTHPVIQFTTLTGKTGLIKFADCNNDIIIEGVSKAIGDNPYDIVKGNNGQYWLLEEIPGKTIGQSFDDNLIILSDGGILPGRVYDYPKIGSNFEIAKGKSVAKDFLFDTGDVHDDNYLQVITPEHDVIIQRIDQENALEFRNKSPDTQISAYSYFFPIGDIDNAAKLVKKGFTDQWDNYLKNKNEIIQYFENNYNGSDKELVIKGIKDKLSLSTEDAWAHFSNLEKQLEPNVIRGEKHIEPVTELEINETNTMPISDLKKMNQENKVDKSKKNSAIEVDKSSNVEVSKNNKAKQSENAKNMKQKMKVHPSENKDQIHKKPLEDVTKTEHLDSPPIEMSQKKQHIKNEVQGQLNELNKISIDKKYITNFRVKVISENKIMIEQRNHIGTQNNTMVIDIKDFKQAYPNMVKYQNNVGDFRLLINSYNLISKDISFNEFMKIAISKPNTHVSLLPYSINAELNKQFSLTISKFTGIEGQYDPLKMNLTTYQSTHPVFKFSHKGKTGFIKRNNCSNDQVILGALEHAGYKEGYKIASTPDKNIWIIEEVKGITPKMYNEGDAPLVDINGKIIKGGFANNSKLAKNCDVAIGELIANDYLFNVGDIHNENYIIKVNDLKVSIVRIDMDQALIPEHSQLNAIPENVRPDLETMQKNKITQYYAGIIPKGSEGNINNVKEGLIGQWTRLTENKNAILKYFENNYQGKNKAEVMKMLDEKLSLTPEQAWNIFDKPIEELLKNQKQ